METHVKVAAWLRIVYSGLGLLGAFIVLIVFGGISVLVGSSGGEDAEAAPWLAVFGASVAAFVGLLAVPGLVTGWGLLNYRPWARIANIVLSALDLFTFPAGTALGAYSLWVMLQPETVALLDDGHVPGRYPTHF
jgi:hypothetical protein